MIRPINILNAEDRPLLIQQYDQYSRNVEKTVIDVAATSRSSDVAGGFLESPTDYDIPLPYTTPTPYVTIWARTITMFPDDSSATLTIYYIPDIQAISSVSPQWTSWFPHNTNFETLFNTTTVHASLSQFEEAFLYWALADYIRSKGSANYKVFQQSYKEEVAWAVLNKPTLFKEGRSSYFMAPYS